MKIALSLFTTTKGHYGKQYLWRDTWNSFRNAFDDKAFKIVPFVNIVRSAGHDNVFNDMISFFHENGVSKYHIFVRDAEWKHHEQSFHIGYMADFFTVYNNQDVLDCDYCFHLEDDWIILDHNDIKNKTFRLISELNKHKEIFQVRLCHNKNEIERIKSLPDNLSWKKNIEEVDCDFFVHSDLFSFNPHINRPRDIMMTINYCNSVYNQYELLRMNFEMGFTEIIRKMGHSNTPFGALNYDFLPIKHIGIP